MIQTGILMFHLRILFFLLKIKKLPKPLKTTPFFFLNKLSSASAPEFNRMCSYRELKSRYISSNSVFFHLIKRKNNISNSIRDSKTSMRVLPFDLLYNRIWETENWTLSLVTTRQTS